MNLNTGYQLIKNMGLRYVMYRIQYSAEKKLGVLKRKFPVHNAPIQFISVDVWKKNKSTFIANPISGFELSKTETLSKEAHKILNGEICYFGYDWKTLGLNYDWITNPDSGYTYNIQNHWSEISDFNSKTGDIKYVWEKSRFTFIQTILRFDYHFKQHNASFVFLQMEDWIEKNPPNQGPNWFCSQETSLRILNWTYALYFYQDSNELTDVRFQKILNSIYLQIDHVHKNINFSRKLVRNNHAITETLTLYLISLIFPFLPGSEERKKQGKKWFEEEIDYQIYDDGTFLQFSMNYHRVVIQLFSWAIRLADLHHEKFAPHVYEKAYKSLKFLYSSQDEKSGELPNYGANDGALFFKFTDSEYRDYKPQLNTLHLILTGESLYSENELCIEDAIWYGLNSNQKIESEIRFPSLKNKKFTLQSFIKGGYYLIKDEFLSFIRCGNHPDRPSQADNLHLDIWHDGVNLLRDAGSYKYNTDAETLKYFAGSESHNTVMLENYDQMQKGPRFVWLYWTQTETVELTEDENFFIFKGTIRCFQYINSNIRHQRTVKKHKNKAVWEIEDILHNKPPHLKMRQLWHPNPEIEDKMAIIAYAGEEKLSPEITSKFYSGKYGLKESASQYDFKTSENRILTTIQYIVDEK